MHHTLAFCFIFCFITAFLACSVSFAVASKDDKTILIQGRSQLVGPCSDCLPSWNITNDISNFEGITISSSSSNRVTIINLDSYRSPATTSDLQGTLPPSFSKLSELQYLILNRTSISGVIPESYTDLPNLVYMDLSQSEINSTGYPSFGGKKFAKLQYLDLSSTDIGSASLPPSWGTAFPSLTYLDLSGLFFPSDRSAFLPPEWGSMTTLKTLKIKISSDLWGALPESWSGMKSLEYLVLSNNNLNGTLPASWGALSRLQHLDLSSNFFHGDLPPEWASMTSLQTLDLANVNTDAVLLSGNLPREWGASLRNLTYLDLSYHQISGPIPDEYRMLTQMQMFDVTSNQLSGNLPEWLGEWSKLWAFRVGFNSFSGSIPNSLSNWNSSILVFNVESNKLSGALPSSTIASWQYLETFNVQHNQLDGTIPKELFGKMMTQNQQLDAIFLANNLFEGPLPLPNVATTQFIANSNRFSGTIPPEFFTSAPNLGTIYLQDNQLSGSIPSEVCHASTYLETALFSRNCLEVSDEVLKCLAKLDNFFDDSDDYGNPEKVDLTPSCLEVRPIVTSLALTSPYSYNVVNFFRNDTQKCSEWLQNIFDGISFVSVSDITLVYSPAGTSQVAGGLRVKFTTDTVFRFAVSTTENSIPLSSSCVTLLYKASLQCFLDKEGTIPCHAKGIAYSLPPFNNQTTIASSWDGTFIVNASGLQSTHGVFYRIFVDAALNFAAEFNFTDYVTPVPPSVRLNASSPVFQPDSCQQNTSAAIKYTTDCTICPELASCDGTTDFYASTVVPTWRQSIDALPFYSCPSKTTKGCYQNNLSYPYHYDGSFCRDNFRGFLCTKCDEGFGMVGGECLKCRSKGVMIGIFSACVIALIVVVTLFVYFSLDSVADSPLESTENEESCVDCTTLEQKLEQYRPHLEKLTVIVRMLVNHFTLLGALSSTSAAHQASDAIKGLLAFQNSGGGGVFFGSYTATLSCLFPSSSESVLNFNLLWAVFGVVLIFESCLFLVLTRKLVSSATVALFLTFIAFSPLAEYSSKLLALCKTFTFYNTRDYLLYGTTASSTSTTKLLSSDFAQECNADFESSARVGAALTITLFCGLVPPFIAFAYKKISSQHTRDEIFSFVTKKYRSSAWYYELIIMFRKLLIALTISMFVDEAYSDLQLQLYTLITTMMFGLSLSIQPFESRTANIVDQVSIASALVCSSMLSVIKTFPQDKGVDVTSSVLIFLTQIVTIVAIVVFGHWTHDEKSGVRASNKAYDGDELSTRLMLNADDNADASALLMTEKELDSSRSPIVSPMNNDEKPHSLKESEDMLMKLKKENERLNNVCKELEKRSESVDSLQNEISKLKAELEELKAQNKE